MTAVQTAIRIPEIAQLIGWAVRDMYWYLLPEVARPDLLALALTCKALHEPVMDILWHSITDFNRLLSCLPESVWRPVKYNLDFIPFDGRRTRQQIKIFQLPLESTHWARFELYASRIRCLSLDTEKIHSTAFREFCERYGPAGAGCNPFVNLNSLVWKGPLSGARSCSFLIVPKVVAITLQPYGPPSGAEDAGFFARLCHVRSLATSFPGRRCFTGMLPHFCFSVAYNNLATLDLTHAISTRSLYELRSIPRLRYICLTYVLSEDFPFPTLDPAMQSFPSLHHLRVEVDSNSNLPAFLRSITGPLEEVELGVMPGGIYVKDFHNILDSLRLHRTLSSFTLCAEVAAIEDVPRLDFQSLAGLRGCAKLTELQLVNIGVRLRSRDLELLGAAWPQLTELTLTPPPLDEFCDNPPFSLLDLREFAVHFPLLTSLYVHFSVTDSAFEQYLQLPPVHAIALESLKIPTCPINDSPTTLGEIAAIISEVFPAASIDPVWVSWLYEDHEYMSAHDEDYQIDWERRWLAVSELARQFKSMRERAVASNVAA